MHPLLERQLAKYFGNNMPGHPHMEDFLEAISSSYVKDDIKNKTIDNIFQIFKEESNLENASVKHAINESSLSAIINKKGKIVSINKKLELLLNVRSSDVANCHPIELLSSDQKPMIDCAKSLLREGKTWQGEIKFTTDAGKIIWLEATASPMINPKSKKTAYLLLFNDVTTRKIYEQEIIKSEKRNRDLINYSQAVICTHDMSGIILSMNPAGCELLGYSRNEIVGKCITDFMPPELRSKFLEEYLVGLQKNHILEGVLKVQSKLKKPISLLFKNYKVKEEGQDKYVIGFAQDITERIEAEKELKNAKQAAEESDRIKELFLSNMSHEIRTPMNGIVGLTKLLLKSPLNEQQRKYAHSVIQNAEELLRVFNNLFDFNKLKEGRSKVKKATFDLSSLFYNLHHTYKPIAIRKNIELVSTIDDKIQPFLLGDSHKLNQLLMNLISNAFKFTEKGKIIFSADLLSENSTECHIRFSITDTGIGIQSSKLQNIFESFTQANSDSSRKHGGLGLGLTIVKDLLELMNSNIQLESVYEKGSTFSFVLHFEKSNPKAVINQPATEMILEGSLKGIKILLAEDNRVNQLFASELMSEWGADLDIADNGQIALELYLKNHYDIILMDIQMPEVDGIDATQIIRNQFPKNKQNIPIIAITANSNNGDEHKYKEYGMNDVIFKPYNSTKLYKKIQKYLSVAQKIQSATSSETEIENTPENKLLFQHASLHVLKSFSRGKESFIINMLNAIITTVPPSIIELNNAIQKKDWISVSKYSHKLIPNMNMSGNMNLEMEMKWIENHATMEENQPEIIAKWPAIKLEVEKTMSELQQADTFYKSRTFRK